MDALIRKTGLLIDLPKNPLAGKMTALLDLCPRLPEQIWYKNDANIHDQRFRDDGLGALKVGSLLLFDKGYMYLLKKIG